MCIFMVMLEGRTMRRLESYEIYHQLWLDSTYLAGFLSSPELIGMLFARLYLDLIEKVFSGVQPWFRILIGKLVEL